MKVDKLLNLLIPQLCSNRRLYQDEIISLADLTGKTIGDLEVALNLLEEEDSEGGLNNAS